MFAYIAANAVESEMEAHNDLVKDGACPIYPSHLIGMVHKDPEAHADLLRPWLPGFGLTGRVWSAYDTDSCHESILQKQWARWKDFRCWQRDNRWLEEDDEGEYAAYVESWKLLVQRDYPPGAVEAELAKIDALPSCRSEGWKLARTRRSLLRHHCKEFPGGVNFLDYVNAARNRLARHGFNRPFQLDQDPKQQDRLSTWIEYLYFEYWWLDRYTQPVERLQPDEHEAWQVLVDSHVLRPHETREDVLDFMNTMREAHQLERAQKAVQKAQGKAEQVYKTYCLHPVGTNILRPERSQVVWTATRDLMTAKDRLAPLLKRHEHLVKYAVETSAYHAATKDAARHRLLLPWILQQIPLIEAEMSKPASTVALANVGTKRKPDVDDANAAQPGPKKRKMGSAVPADVQRRLLQAGGSGATHTSPGLAAGLAVLQRPRRSARLRARLAMSET